MSFLRIIAAITTAACTAGVAQTHGSALAVDELVGQALAGNPQLRMLEAEIAVARGERTQAGAWKNPELSALVGRKDARDSENVLQGSGVEFGVELSQTFEFPGKAVLRKAMADRNITLAEAAVGQFVQVLTARIRGLAADLIASEAKAATARDMAGEADLIAQLIAQRPGAGPQQAIETRLIEATLVAIRKTVLEVESHAEEVRGELNLLRGQPPSAPLSLKDSGTAPPHPRSLQRLLLSVGPSHPRVQLRALEFERASLALAAARLGASPDISLGPYYSWQQAGDLETSVGASVSLSIPLWDQGKGSIAAAQAREEKAAAAVLLARRETEAEITRRYREWQRSAGVVEQVTPARLQSFREATDLASRQFRTGAIPVQLYLDMLREYLSAAEIYHEAVATMTSAAAEIEQLTAAPKTMPQAPAQTRNR